MSSESSVYGDAGAVLDAFEQVPMPALILDGPELIVAACNAELRARIGNRPVVGRPLPDAMPELAGQQWFDLCEQVMSTGETVTGDSYRVHYARPDGTFTESFVNFAVVPWRKDDGTVRGVIGYAMDDTRRVLAQRVADDELASARRRYQEARSATLATQRALLPDSVPVMPMIDVAARYVLAADEQAAGGDWFDVVANADGMTTFVVGDVVGHGTTAAAAMGQLRAVLLASLRAGASLGEALQQLDGFARSEPGARSATVCVVQLDGATGELQYCSAGHPPPLVLPAGDEAPYFLDQVRSGPLVSGRPFEVASARLGLGATLVMYTDGLIERPGVSLAAGLEELRRIASDARDNVLMPANAPRHAVDRVCELSIELLTRAHPVRDDITMLSACRHASPPDFLVAVPADDGLVISASLGDLRQWLFDLGSGPASTTAIMQAVTELVDNVVDHAYGDVDGGTVSISARLGLDGRCRVDVADRGQWRRPTPTVGRGLGLALVRRLTQSLDIDTDVDGTTVRIVLPRRAVDDDFTAELADDGRTLRVGGVLDARAVAELDAQIDLTLASAGTALQIDLTDVTLLASAGVHLLRQAVDDASRAGGRVVLYAPADSPAQQVLAMTATPHVTSAT